VDGQFLSAVLGASLGAVAVAGLLGFAAGVLLIFGLLGVLVRRQLLGRFAALVGALRSNQGGLQLLGRLLDGLLLHAPGYRQGEGWCPFARQKVRDLVETLQSREGEERAEGG